MKAWEIVGYTRDGDVYCADCGTDVYAGAPSDEEPNPVFASDEIPNDWTCGSCDAHIVDESLWANQCEICGTFSGVPCECYN